MDKRIVLALVLFVFLVSVSSSFSDVFPDFQYRVPIQIHNPNSNDLTDFQVKLDIPYNSHMNANYSDLRFSDGGVEIPYWIESYNSTDAIVWIKVPFIPSNGNSTIYMYYGNSTATSKSNGDKVFEFFDDFNGNSLNTSKWYVSSGATYSVSDGWIHVVSGNAQSWSRNGIVKKGAISIPSSIEIHGGNDDTSTYNVEASLMSSQTPEDESYSTWITWQYSGSWTIRNKEGSSSYGSYSSGVSNGAVNLRYDLIDDETVDTYINGKNFRNFNLPQISNAYFLLGGDRSGVKSKWDYIFIRKYASQEPTATFGNEELTSNSGNGVLSPLKAWCRMQEINIYNPNSYNLTDFQVELNVQKSPLMNPDLSDLRFATSSGFIPYYIDNIYPDHAIVWVKVPFLESGKNTTIYMYYGNPSATSKSSPKSVFDLYDDFNSGVLNTSLWGIASTGGTYSFSSGVIHLSANSGSIYGLVSKNPISDKSYGTIVEMYSKTTSDYNGYLLVGSSYTTADPSSTSYWYRINDNHYGTGSGWSRSPELEFQYKTESSVYTPETYSTRVFTSYILHTIKMYKNKVTWTVGSSSYSQSSNIIYNHNENSPLYLYIYTYSGGDTYVDWVRTYKIADKDPIVYFGKVKPLASVVDTNGVEHIQINYTSKLFGYSDVNPNLYVHSCFESGDKVSLGYAGQNHFLRISDYGTASEGASGIDLDIFPFLAVYPGRISANISNNIGISQDYNFGYYVTKMKIDNNKLNITVLSFDNNWNSIDRYLKENDIIIHDPKIIFDLYYPNGSLYYENLIFSNNTFSIPLPKDFSRETYRFYYNGIWSDTIPPNVTFIVPSANQYYFGGVKELKVKVKDDSPISWVIANVDGTNYTLNSMMGNLYSNNSVDFGTGTHNLTVYATDIYNNTRIVRTKFYVYNSPVVGINYSSYYNKKLNEDLLKSPYVNVSAYYGVFDNGIVIPLNSEFVPISDQQHFLGYYIFNTKALIDAGVLWNNCSNMAVYTYNNKEISYSIVDCGSANAKLIVNTTDPLYVLVGQVGNEFQFNAPGYSKPAHVGSVILSSLMASRFLDINGNSLLYYKDMTRIGSYGEVILDKITPNGLKEVAKTCNLSFVASTARIINTSDGVYALIPTSVRSEQLEAPIDNGYNPRYAGSMYLVKFKGEHSVPIKILDIYTNIPAPSNTFLMYSKEQFEASAIGNKILMTSANNSYLLSLNGSILKKFNYGNLLTVAQKDYKGKWYLIQFNDSNGDMVLSKISPDGSIETKDLKYHFEYNYWDLDKNSMLYIKNDIAYFIDSGNLYKLDLLNGELIGRSPQGLPFPLPKGIPLHLPRGDEYLVSGSLNVNKDVATFLYVNRNYVNDEAQYNLTNYEVNLNSGNEKVITLSQLYSGWDYSSTYSSPFESNLYLVLSLNMWGSNSIKVFSLDNTNVFDIPKLNYGSGKLNNVESLNITLKNLNTGEVTKLNVPANSKLINFSNYDSGIYLLNATAINNDGKTTSYSEFIWDKDKPNIQYSISQDGDYVNVTYNITDNFGLESCKFNGNEIPCKGAIKLEYPKIHMGLNKFKFDAMDIVGNGATQQMNINVNCIHLKPLNNTPLGVPGFYYKGSVRICPGTYHINYPIISDELNLTGVTLIGDGGQTSYESLKRGNAEFINGIMGTSVYGTSYESLKRGDASIINGMDTYIYGGTLENFDVAAMNSILNGTVIRNSNILYNMIAVNSKFENVSGISGLVANSTVDGLPVIFVSDENDPSLNVVNYTDISPKTLGMSKIGGLIIVRNNVKVHNLTIEGGMLGVVSRNVTIENNTLKNLGIIDLDFYEGNGTFTDNYVINTKTANILGGLVYNNYFNNSHVPDVSILSYSNLKLNVPLNCSETSIIGGCVGGNHWTTYYGPYNKTEKIGLNSKKFMIENFGRHGNSISNIIDKYPLVNSNKTTTINTNFSNIYGTSAGVPAYPNMNKMKRAGLKKTVEVLTETPPIVSGDSLYFIKSDVVKTKYSKGLASFYIPNLVKYNLTDGKIEWRVPLCSYFDTGSYRDIMSYTFEYKLKHRWMPKIMTNGKLVCAGTTPNVMKCFDVKNGKEVVSPLDLVNKTLNNQFPGIPDINHHEWLILNYYNNFYLYNDTMFVFSERYSYNHGLGMVMCKVNLYNSNVVCSSPVYKGVLSYRSNIVYDPKYNIVYAITTDNSQYGSSIYEFNASDMNLIGNKSLPGIPTTQPVVIDGAVYVGTAIGNNYNIYRLKNGYPLSIQIYKKPNYIGSFDDNLLVTTGDFHNISKSVIYIIDRGLNVNSKEINGVAMLPTSVNGMVYVPFVENVTNTNTGCANRPITYKVGVIALDKNFNKVWEFAEDYNTSLSYEIPAPMVVVPNGKDLLVPVIHYYVNSTNRFRIPFEGLNKYVGYVGPETIYVLTSQETCSDVSNSNGMSCSFHWDAPHHGYITSGSSNGTCYQGDCHLNCNSGEDINGINLKCKQNTGGSWQYCCGSDSLYQICIEDTHDCPFACGGLNQPCCSGNICNAGLHCGCETGKSGVYCVSNNYYFFNNNLWGNWNSFLNGNEACCVNGWQQVIIK